MQLGLCLDPVALAALPARPSCDFIEGHVQNFLLPESLDAAFVPKAAAQRACPLPMPAANCFFPPSLRITGPDVDLDHIARYADTTFRRSAEIGLSLIVFGSGGARTAPAGWSTARAFEQYAAALRLLAPLAAKHGVTVVVEPLQRGECNFLNTIVEGAEVVRRAESPSVRLLVDIFHMLRNGESPDDIVRVGPLVRHAHIAENRDRAAPGVHGEDFRPFLRALRQTGYDARLTIEAVWTDLATQAAPALAALRTQLTDAGY